MICAIVLAGGESRRMGQPKMLLQWGAVTVLEQVIAVLRAAGMDEIEVVTGAARKDVEELCQRQDVRTVFNPAFSQDEMLGSLQAGLHAMEADTDAAVVTLGDQPQIQAATVRAVLKEFQGSKSQLIVPSYQKHRGHPWLVGRPLWEEILQMQAPNSPREFLNRHAAEIRYVEIESPSILMDIDTPEDYKKARPRGAGPKD